MKDIPPPRITGNLIAIIVLGVAVFLAISFLYGDLGTAWLDIKPGPDPADMLKERGAAFKSLNLQSSEAVKGSSLKSFAEGRGDRCYQGQNDFKVKDGYAHRCTAKVTRYFGFNGDFRKQILALDQSLLTKGWANVSGQSVDETMPEYFDRYYRTTHPRTGEPYLVSNLPRPCYERNLFRLCVDFAERSSDPFRLESFQKTEGGYGRPDYERNEYVEIGPLFTEIVAENEYVIAISIEKHYFEN